MRECTVEIRYLSEQDSLYDVSRVYEQSWKYAYKGIVPQSYLDAIPDGHWANDSLKNTMSNLVALEDGRIIGTLGFCKARWEGYAEYGEIVSIYLLPEYMGKGYGRAMLVRAVEALDGLGFKQVILWVLEDNTCARAFYEKLGFVPKEEYMTDSFDGVELREKLYILESSSHFGHTGK